MLVFNNKCGGGGSGSYGDFDTTSDRILTTSIAYSTSYEFSVIVDYDGNVLVSDFDMN